MAAVAGGVDDAASADPLQARSGPTWRLPVELLLQCLRASDPATRIRASHVCRTWSKVALAERRLWNSFLCSHFRDEPHEHAMFSLLQVLLLRSRPLPFHLGIPYSYRGTDSSHAKRFLALEAFDIRRLAAYQGPVRIFEQLNPARNPLPALVCLELEPYDNEYSAVTTMAGQLGSRCLPNLQELSVGSVGFPEGRAPFLLLQSVTIACMHGLHHRALFAHCPRLVRLVITDSPMGTPLPDPPAPPTLEEVSVRCARPLALDVTDLLRHWRDVRVPRLTVGEAYSLQGVLPLFLASHAQMIEMRLPGGGGDVVLAEIPDDESVWTLSPSPPWASDFLASIEQPTSERLTSISVAFSRLGALLRAQLHAPGLETLELRLDSTGIADSPPLENGEAFFLRAPRLLNVSFNLVNVGASLLENDLAVLHRSFRTLLIYDAELLDTILVSRQAERVCAGFAPLAKDYAVNSGRSRLPIIRMNAWNLLQMSRADLCTQQHGTNLRAMNRTVCLSVSEVQSCGPCSTLIVYYAVLAESITLNPCSVPP